MTEKREPKNPTSKEDLDMEMDKCIFYSRVLFLFNKQPSSPPSLFVDWFAHGKGPNPEKVALDKELEEYNKNAAASAATTTIA